MKYLKTVGGAVRAGKKVDEAFLAQFIDDPKLINHILFFSKSFPGYKLVPTEIIAEGNRVFVRANFIGMHQGEVEDIPPTAKPVKVPFALVYTIKDEKIVDFWAIADQMEFFEQLGLAREEVNVE